MSERFDAWRFDGRTAEAYAATVWLDGATLVLESGGTAQRVPIAQVRISEPFEAAPRIVFTEGGETFEVTDGPGFTRAIESAGVAVSPVVRLQRHGPAVVVALGLLVAAFVWAYLRGVPLLAREAVRATPQAVQQELGDEVLEVLDEVFLRPSALASDTRAQIEQRFLRAAELAAPAHRVRLVFRSFIGDPGPEQFALGEEAESEERKGMINALSLPGGTIVVLDGLVEAADRDQLFAVLGHELGHVVLDHSLQSFYQSAGVAALAGLAWGDFSGVAASVPATLGLLRYGRQHEDEADDFAVRFVTIEGLDAEDLCRFFELVAALEPDEGGDFPEFLSTHPDLDARVARLCPDRASD